MPRWLNFEGADERAATIRANKRKSRKALQITADKAAAERQKMQNETAKAVEVLQQRGQTERNDADNTAQSGLRKAQAAAYSAEAASREQEADINQQILDTVGVEGLIGDGTASPRRKGKKGGLPDWMSDPAMKAQKSLDDQLADLSGLLSERATAPGSLPQESAPAPDPYTMLDEDYYDRDERSTRRRKALGSYFYDTFIGGGRGRQ